MSLEAWRSTRTDSFNAESGFPRGQNAVTSAQMVRCPNVAVWIRDTRLLAGGNHGAQYAREHVSRGWTQCNLRSCRGASARGSHHFAGQPCSFRRDCTYASRYVRVTSQASRGKRCGGGCVAGASGARIETEADELVRLLGDDAYSEARWREHTASSSASAQESGPSAAIVATANLAFPPKTVALRILDREGQAVFERYKSDRR